VFQLKFEGQLRFFYRQHIAASAFSSGSQGQRLLGSVRCTHDGHEAMTAHHGQIRKIDRDSEARVKSVDGVTGNEYLIRKVRAVLDRSKIDAFHDVSISAGRSAGVPPRPPPPGRCGTGAKDPSLARTLRPCAPHGPASHYGGQPGRECLAEQALRRHHNIRSRSYGHDRKNLEP
jgi:hypothetical protein